MKKRRILATLFIFLFCKLATFSAEYTLEELNNLRNLNLIKKEDYEVLKAELLQGTSLIDNLYSLKINGKRLSRDYKVIVRDGRQYFELQGFFSVIGFTNFYPENNRFKILLGESLEEIIIEYNTNKIFVDGKELKIEGEYPKFSKEDNTLYLERDIFKYLFLNDLFENDTKAELEMHLGFTPPVAIDQLLDISMANLDRENSVNEIIYNGKRELFNLGYMRIEAGNSWTRTEEDSRYKSEWDGKLSYQGGLLFGELQFEYDMKEKEFQNFSLDYDQIWKEHTLEISKTNFSGDGEWGFHFYKDRGFYNIGDTIVIREKVPVGSRAELLYMGTPIAIEDEQNGEVIFSNAMIRSDRDYQLKIYYPDGKIIMKDIRTSEDYNRQQKGEVEYDFNFNENASEHGYDTDINFYYGLTDKLTFGGGFTREITPSNLGKKEYASSLKNELTYGDTLNGYSYTLQLSSERSLSSYHDESDKNLKDRNQFGYLVELTKNKWRTKFEQIKYDKFYDEKEENNLEITYDVTDALRLEYIYEDTKYRATGEEGSSRAKEKSSKFGFSYDKTIGRVLLGTSADFDLEDSRNNEYNFNVYYSGFKSFTIRLENTWTNNGEDYEVSLNLYNNNLGGLVDISAELKYSNVEKESFGLTFSMTLDSWFTVDVDGDEHGNNSVRVGIDKIVDLKNPTMKIDNMDISRAKIVTFVDQNNNNMFDKGEPTVEGVEVRLGTHTVVTDENGVAHLYNLSNGIIYELEPTIKKPSYTMGNNIIKIQSNFSSDVDVFIPIKPMMNLNGFVNLDKTLNIPENKVEKFYSNIIIQILDKDGKEVDLASPDNTGYFDISGLFPEEYMIKIYYIGSDYNILDMNEKLKLKYDEENGFDFEIKLNITDEEIELLDSEKLAKVENDKIVKLEETTKEKGGRI